MSLTKAVEAAKKAVKVVKRVVKKPAEKAAASASPASKEVKVTPSKPKDKAHEFAATLKDNPLLGTLTIGNEKAVAFPMKVLEKHFVDVFKTKVEDDARLADVYMRMEISGDWAALGSPNAAEYYERKHGITYSSVRTHLNAMRLLGALGTKGADLTKVYRKYNPSRLAAVYGYALRVAPTQKELLDDLAHCERESNQNTVEFRNYLQQKYAARLAKAKDDENEGLPESQLPVKIEAFKVPAVIADTIRESLNVAIKESGNGQLQLGDAIGMACSEYVGNFGVNYTSLKRALDAIAHRYNVLPLVMPNPDITDMQNKSLKEVPVLQAFEHKGTYILHVSRAKAAKALGVKTEDVTVIRLNLQAAMRDLYGWEEQMAKTELPPSIDEMGDEDVLEAIGRLKNELKIGRDEWSKFAVGKSSRDQLLGLLKMKSAKEAKTATPVKEQSSEDVEEPPETVEAFEVAEASLTIATPQGEVIKPVSVKVTSGPTAAVKKKKVVVRKKK